MQPLQYQSAELASHPIISACPDRLVRFTSHTPNQGFCFSIRAAAGQTMSLILTPGKYALWAPAQLRCGWGNNKNHAIGEIQCRSTNFCDVKAVARDPPTTAGFTSSQYRELSWAHLSAASLFHVHFIRTSSPQTCKHKSCQEVVRSPCSSHRVHMRGNT